MALVALLPQAGMAQGQQGSGSPYSAYGLGSLVGSTQASQAMMGGAGIAVYDPYSVMQVNPASYASLSRPAFETAMVLRMQQFRGEGLVRNGRRADLLGLTFGVPFGNGRWGMALGLTPVSAVHYSISDKQPLQGDTQPVEYEYSGSGGLNRAFAGFGHNIPFERDSLGNGTTLSFGANFNYDFGSIDETRKAIYPRSAGFVNTMVVNSLSLGGLVFGIGARLQGDLVPKRARTDKGLLYLAGASVELPGSLNAEQSGMVSSYSLGSSGIEFPLDTISFSDGIKGSLTVPPIYVLGFTVYNAQWAVTMEHRRRDWSQLKIDLEGMDLRSDLGVNAQYIVGGSFRPAGDGRGTFWTSTVYRAGLRYADDYLLIGDKQLNEIGMSFGMSLPLMGSTTRSRLNLGAELGRTGSNEEGLIQQRFAHFFVGITITPDLREQWFKKRRIE